MSNLLTQFRHIILQWFCTLKRCTFALFFFFLCIFFVFCILIIFLPCQRKIDVLRPLVAARLSHFLKNCEIQYIKYRSKLLQNIMLYPTTLINISIVASLLQFITFDTVYKQCLQPEIIYVYDFILSSFHEIWLWLSIVIEYSIFFIGWIYFHN